MKSVKMGERLNVASLQICRETEPVLIREIRN